MATILVTPATWSWTLEVQTQENLQRSSVQRLNFASALAKLLCVEMQSNKHLWPPHLACVWIAFGLCVCCRHVPHSYWSTSLHFRAAHQGSSANLITCTMCEFTAALQCRETGGQVTCLIASLKKYWQIPVGIRDSVLEYQQKWLKHFEIFQMPPDWCCSSSQLLFWHMMQMKTSRGCWCWQKCKGEK